MKLIHKQILTISMFLYNLSCVSMNTVTILTSDAKTYVMDRKVIEQSTTINHILEDIDTDSDNQIPVPISSSVFNEIKPLLILAYYSKFHRDDQEQALIEYLKANEEKYKTTPKNVYGTYIDIFNVANYLDCQPILAATSSVLADTILQQMQTNHQTIDSIVQTINEQFNLPDELSIMLSHDLINNANPIGSAVPSVNEIIEIFNTVKRQNKTISAMSYSPDFTLFAYAISGEGIHIYDFKKASERTLESTGVITALAFSPNNEYIATVSNEQKRKDTLRVWNLKAHWNKPLSEVNKNSIYSLAFSYDNEKLLSNNTNNSASFWTHITNPNKRFEKPYWTEKTKNAIGFDSNREHVSDPLYLPNKIIVALYNSIDSELQTLKAEYSILFIWILQSLFKNGNVVLDNPKTQQLYKNLIQNKAIAELFAKNVTLKNEYINYLKSLVTF